MCVEMEESVEGKADWFLFEFGNLIMHLRRRVEVAHEIISGRKNYKV